MSSASDAYTVQYDPKVVKELAKLDKAVARRILRAVTSLGGDPLPNGVRSLVGFPDFYRLRVGDYRVIYTIKSEICLVLVLRVAHRSSVYRNL